MPNTPTGTIITPMSADQVAVASGQKPRLRVNLDGSYTISGVNGPNDFFGPQQPILPQAQEAAWGRQFDFPVGFNTRTVPRQEEIISFDTLKNLADGYDMLRIIIERCKDLHLSYAWTIGPKDESKARDKRCDELEAFFAYPDKQHSWADWLRMLLEQLFVLDAVSILTQRTRGGDVYALQLLDGATIRRTIDDTGRTPMPPDPAYQEIIKGMPAVNYTTNDLTYAPRNLRIHKIYGYSPVEQIVTTVNIALNRQLYMLKYYTEGTTPDLIFSVPAGWSASQLETFEKSWNAKLSGQLGERRKTSFVPDGAKPFDTKEKALTDAADEWLIRVCCFAFSITPLPFVKAMNRAVAESHHDQAMQEGLEPIQRYVSNLINHLLVTRWGITDLTHKWVEDEAIDPLEQASIYEKYTAMKVVHPDEVRQKLGMKPMTPEMRDQMDSADYSGNTTAGGGADPFGAAGDDAEEPGKEEQPKKPVGGSDSAKLGKQQGGAKSLNRSSKNVGRY